MSIKYYIELDLIKNQQVKLNWDQLYALSNLS